MPFPTAAQRRIAKLYHWQVLDPARLEVILRNNTIYCSRPADFNDPWDCRPFFNDELLDDPAEVQRCIDWSVRICEAAGQMGPDAIERMRAALRDPRVLAEKIREISLGTAEATLARYRVYCLCPALHNALLWAHYADKHRGICLEFDTRNDVVSGALQVQYHGEFPMTRIYSDDLRENLLSLVAKSDVWAYEKEFRLVAQEEGVATPHDTLRTHNGQLQLPAGALTAIIVGCQGDFARVQQLVKDCGADVAVRRTRKIDDRYGFEVLA
jgi:hypothetical protein